MLRPLVGSLGPTPPGSEKQSHYLFTGLAPRLGLSGPPAHLPVPDFIISELIPDASLTQTPALQRKKKNLSQMGTYPFSRGGGPTISTPPKNSRVFQTPSLSPPSLRLHLQPRLPSPTGTETVEQAVLTSSPGACDTHQLPTPRNSHTPARALARTVPCASLPRLAPLFCFLCLFLPSPPNPSGRPPCPPPASPSASHPTSGSPLTQPLNSFLLLALSRFFYCLPQFLTSSSP